jgi:acyl carrier protein
MNSVGSVTQGVIEIIEEVAGVPATEVGPEKNLLQDLDVDSLAVVEIGVAIFERFQVEIEDGELTNIKTVADLVEHVEGRTT